MFFSWFKHRRRRRMLAEPFPREWDEYLRLNVRHEQELNREDRQKLRNLIRIFVAEKYWEGCGGLTMTDEIKVTIAAQACLLVLGFEEEYLDHVRTILVYPTTYVVPEKSIDRVGIETVGRSRRMGEAWYQGPVILSWEDALASGRSESDGQNVVLHEFAHQLDMLNGHVVDGTPPLPSEEMQRRWRETMQTEYQQLISDCRHDVWTVFDCYGTTDLPEFFAVATESFFEEPEEMSARHPEMYTLFCEFYRQDPAMR